MLRDDFISWCMMIGGMRSLNVVGIYRVDWRFKLRGMSVDILWLVFSVRIVWSFCLILFVYWWICNMWYIMYWLIFWVLIWCRSFIFVMWMVVFLILLLSNIWKGVLKLLLIGGLVRYGLLFIEIVFFWDYI